MSPPSSTSASDRSRRRFLAAFFGVGMVVFLGVNLGLLEAYRWRRYGAPDGEYARKMQNALRAQAEGRPIAAVFAGDSTISVGIMPRVLGPGFLNLAWSGFEPSELRLLEERLLSFPAPPTRVFLGINPTYLSQNEWRDTLSVPPVAALRDGIASFYADTSSFKPLLVMGGLAALSARFLTSPLEADRSGREAPASRRTVEPDGLLVVEPEGPHEVAPQRDMQLPFRRANFRMLEAFRDHLRAKGVRVTWIFMPYSPALERVFREGPSAREFFVRYQDEIRRIFGGDAIDLSGSVPAELFRDEGHLTEQGARVLTLELAARLGPSPLPGRREPESAWRPAAAQAER